MKPYKLHRNSSNVETYSSQARRQIVPTHRVSIFKYYFAPPWSLPVPYNELKLMRVSGMLS